ncbi:MAG: bifunctional DNA-formamidopyrimidine glycosylase/DNA-(apurinic or apyrimidinic site) lyase [Candidatus Woesebacteria bacterium]
MPELPEVETIRSQIEKHLLGVQITEVKFPDRSSKVLHGNLEQVEGQKITGVRRFGKLLIIDLSDSYSLAIHLKMTGRLMLFQRTEEIGAHTHVVFTLADGRQLTFSDMRRFGYVEILPTVQVSSLRFLQTLGKEPLKDLTLADFKVLLKKTRRPIKTLLLDQRKIAGIGNIYACESLWMAKIPPQVSAISLSPEQAKKLFIAIEDVLKEGIKRGGASDNTYRNLMGGKGKYQDFFKVYMRAGKPCRRCGTLVKRITLGGRGTFFCPECQK